MKKITDKELLMQIKSELNQEIAWLNHHIDWLRNELKHSNSTYYEGLLTAYIEIKIDLTRISNNI